MCDAAGLFNGGIAEALPVRSRHSCGRLCVPNFPDPTFSRHGRAVVRPALGGNPQSLAFLSAQFGLVRGRGRTGARGGDAQGYVGAVERGPADAQRRACGLDLEPMGDVLEQFDRLDRVFVLTSAAFDFGAITGAALPANVRYVGPQVKSLRADG